MVKIFGWELSFGKDINKRINDEVDKRMAEETSKTMRTAMEMEKLAGDQIVRLPFFPLPEEKLYEIAALSDILRLVIKTRTQEIFRNGYDIHERFAKKCTNCGKEFENPVDECDECKKVGLPSNKLREPIVDQRKLLEKFAKRINQNDQSIIEMSKMSNNDIETIDDGYMLCIKDYLWDSQGKMLGYDPKEIIRVSPMKIKIIADATGRPGRDKDGKLIKTCLEHRDQYWQDRKTCPMCGKELFTAYYRGEMPEGKYVFYVKNEVHHESEYMPSLTYGFSPILSVWMKLCTLTDMDRFMLDYYSKEKPPRGMLLVNTPNQASFQKSWKYMVDKSQENPHMIPPLAIETGDSDGKGTAIEFIDFLKSMDEMQFTEVRDEFRKIIGATYGVMPIWSADVSISGGLNNEGLQITITNRAIEEGQRVFNEGFFPWILRQLNVTDYELVLNPSEERDEMAEQQREAQKIQNARMMQAMGYEVTLNEDGEFEYEPTEVPVTPPQTGLEGLPPLGDSGQAESENTASATPENLQRDAPVTSTTTGAHNPRYNMRVRDLEELIGKTFDNVLKESGKKMSMKQKADGVSDFARFLTASIFRGKFQGVSQTKSNIIKEYLIRAASKGYPMKRIIKYIARTGGKKVDNDKAETIARTESQALNNKMREWSYLKIDPEGKMKYKWIGPSDNRTTDTCTRIKNLTVQGVSLKKLKNIIETEATKAGFESREWTPHIGCRHTFIRI